MFPRLEVVKQDDRPTQEVHQQTHSVLARRINLVVSALLFSGIEPDQITIDIDRRAVIVRENSNIHLRAL